MPECKRKYLEYAASSGYKSSHLPFVWADRVTVAKRAAAIRGNCIVWQNVNFTLKQLNGVS